MGEVYGTEKLKNERVISALTPQALHPHDSRIHSSTITFDSPAREKNIRATLLCQGLTAQDVSDDSPPVSNSRGGQDERCYYGVKTKHNKGQKNMIHRR